MNRKYETRVRLIAKRNALSVREARERGRRIHARLRGLDEFRSAWRVLSYVSSKDNEADTLGIITGLLREGREVFCPRVSEADLAWFRIESVDRLRPGAFGILEPAPAISGAMSPREVLGSDVIVLVPGIAFTPKGYRIGYGRGYFDRFLRSFGGTSVGLAYDFQIIDEFDPDPHDVPVQIVVTESRVYRRDDAC